ncbi:type IV toxin-antitoxin system AbiEi family antitoxin domain-containing protein [Arthrobacter sp. HLT1-20]
MDTNQLAHLVASRWPAKAVRGAATNRMLEASGLTHKVLTAAVARRIIVRLHRGAYVQALQWQALKPWVRDDVALIAHALASRSSGVYSHSSAARLHGLRTWGCGAIVHLTHGQTPGHSTGRGGVALHQQALGAGNVVMARIGPVQVPMTSMAQTVLDCARLFSLEKAAIIGDHAVRNGLTVPELQELLGASDVKRGAARAKRALEFLDSDSESAGESRTRVFLSATRLPMPELQVKISTRHGQHRADFAWRECRLILEFDGWGKYFEYRPTAEAIALERQREKDLMELGWRFIRINWSDFNDSVALEARIRTALVGAGATFPAVRTAIFA